MRISWRDGLAAVVVAAIVVPYVGYLIAGSMPFVEDPRGMAAIGLLGGIAAALVLGRGGFRGFWGHVAAVIGGFVLATGFATLIWAETGVLAEVLLAVFVGGIVVTWLVAELVDTGVLADHGQQAMAR